MKDVDLRNYLCYIGEPSFDSHIAVILSKLLIGLNDESYEKLKNFQHKIRFGFAASCEEALSIGYFR